MLTLRLGLVFLHIVEEYFHVKHLLSNVLLIFKKAGYSKSDDFYIGPFLSLYATETFYSITKF